MARVFEHIINRSIAHVTRFNASPQHFSESVAEHSFFVAYITRVLVDLLDSAGEQVDKERAVTMALLHDIEESYSGDILGPFKHRSPEVCDAIKKVNKEVINELFDNLPEQLRTHYIELWNEDSTGETLEAQIVKMADKLALIAKCAEEAASGNDFFKSIYQKEFDKLKDDKRLWWRKIKKEVLPDELPLMQQALNL